MKKRIINFIIFVGIFGSFFFLGYLSFITRVDCPFHKFFDILCPFCGGRTMVIDLIHNNFGKAFVDNPVLFIGLPVVFVLLFIKYILNKDIKVPKYAYILLIIITIAFTVIRNIV